MTSLRGSLVSSESQVDKRDNANELDFLIPVGKRGGFWNGRGQQQLLTFRNKAVFVSHSDFGEPQNKTMIKTKPNSF